MTPRDFPGRNIIMGENQPEYQPLPALVLSGPEFEVISCWQFTPDELAAINANGCMYISQLRFGTIKDGIYTPNALQPILPMAELGDNLRLEL